MNRWMLNSVVACLLAVACFLFAGMTVNAAEKMLQGATLEYVEEGSSEGESVTTHMFVNADYLYIQESLSPDDFMLLDRKQQTIHIVTHSERTVFVIHGKSVNIESPIQLGFSEQLDESVKFPDIDGKTVRHFRYTTNDESCYEAGVLPAGFMEEAARAMYEFKQIMAGEHATTLDNMPRDMLTACDLAMNVFYAGEHFKRGLPVIESGPGNYRRFLKSYQPEASMPAAKLILPVDYERFSIGDIVSDVNN